MSFFSTGTKKLCWGESFALAAAAYNDPGTRIGAKVAGLTYPLRTNELATLVVNRALIGRQLDVFLPLPPDNKADATALEVEWAEAELEKSIVFT